MITTGPAVINPLHILLITFDSDYRLPDYALNILLISLYVISTVCFMFLSTVAVL